MDFKRIIRFRWIDRFFFLLEIDQNFLFHEIVKIFSIDKKIVLFVQNTAELIKTIFSRKLLCSIILNRFLTKNQTIKMVENQTKNEWTFDKNLTKIQNHYLCVEINWNPSNRKNPFILFLETFVFYFNLPKKKKKENGSMSSCDNVWSWTKGDKSSCEKEMKKD